MQNKQTRPLAHLQPTQLYISQLKLARARAYLEACNDRDYDPLPVRQIDRVLFLTDGHTRALLLWRAGHTEIRTSLPELHGRGLGTRLVSEAFDRARQKGHRYITVKTLSERHPDPYYAQTRRFYRKLGFVALQEFPELWGKDNPCLYMLCDLAC